MTSVWRDSKVMLAAVLSVAVWIPLCHVEWFSSHEEAWYVLRTVEWANGVRHGDLYPRLCPDFYGGYGSAMFLFMAPLPYATAGLLTATMVDPFTALKLVTLLASLASGLGMYALVFGETRNRHAALLAAMVFLATPYRNGNLFVRGDIGEFTCLGWLPVAIALYRAVALETWPGRARWWAAAAAICHALVIMSHTILGLWGTALIGLVVGASAVGLGRRGMRRRALLLVGAFVCALGLAGIYVVPALAYKGLSKTADMVVDWGDPQTQWLLLRSLFESYAPGTRLPSTFYRIGAVLVLAVAIVTAGLWCNRRTAWPALAWLAVALGLTALTLKPAQWFWAPDRIPLARYIQFPWRLLGPAALMACVAAGIGAASAFDRLSSARSERIAAAIGVALLLAVAWPDLVPREMKIGGVPRDADTIRQGMYSTTGGDEYLPATAPGRPKQPRDQLVVAADGIVTEDAHSLGSVHDLALRADKAGAVATLSLHAFPGWAIATDAGPAPAQLAADDNGLLRVSLPVAGSYVIRVFYGVSRAEWVGRAISAASALALALFLARSRRKEGAAPHRARPLPT